jgi:small subunit ribosomal protein S4
MRNTFEQAAEVKGATGEVMLQNLEQRLDNTVYRAGFAKSRSQARQLVSHGHIKVNDRMTKTPSYQVKAGDAISVRESSRASNYFKEMLAWAKTQTRPGWLETDPENFSAKVLAAPARDQIEAQVNTQLIVEHYSR